jgi:hypothetical protein
LIQNPRFAKSKFISEEALMFERFVFSRHRKAYFLILLILIINSALIFIFYHDHFEQTDTRSYVATVRGLLGKPDGEIYEQRLLKPVSLLVPLLFEAAGMGARFGLQFQGLFFYFFSVLLFAKIIYHLYQVECQSIVASILFVSACPVFFNAFSYLTDMGGWFFNIFMIWLSLRYLSKLSKPPFYFLFGFIGGLSFLFKESAAAGLLFVPFFILFAHRDVPLFRRLTLISFFIAGGLVPIVLCSAIVAVREGYSFLDWYLQNWSAYLKRYLNVLNLIKQAAVAFTLSWIFFLRGLRFEIGEKNQRRIPILLSLIPSSFCWLLWPSVDARFIFVANPLVFMISSFGIVHRTQKLRFSQVLLLICNYGFNFFAPLFLTLSK